MKTISALFVRKTTRIRWSVRRKTTVRIIRRRSGRR